MKGGGRPSTTNHKTMKNKLPSYTLEQQQQFLEEKAKELGFNSWAEYKAEMLDFSDECYDE